jgi:hypothetical protein
MKATHKTPAGRVVILETFSVGRHFGTDCRIRSRNGRLLATLPSPCPYGFEEAAIDRARAVADDLFSEPGRDVR